LEEFFRLISTRVGWSLIRKESDPANGQETVYSITPDGEPALFVYSARRKKRDVASTPGLT
jgi:hypothetical protein